MKPHNSHTDGLVRLGNALAQEGERLWSASLKGNELVGLRDSDLGELVALEKAVDGAETVCIDLLSLEAWLLDQSPWKVGNLDAWPNRDNNIPSPAAGNLTTVHWGQPSRSDAKAALSQTALSQDTLSNFTQQISVATSRRQANQQDPVPQDPGLWLATTHHAVDDIDQVLSIEDPVMETLSVEDSAINDFSGSQAASGLMGSHGVARSVGHLQPDAEGAGLQAVETVKATNIKVYDNRVPGGQTGGQGGKGYPQALTSPEAKVNVSSEAANLNVIANEGQGLPSLAAMTQPMADSSMPHGELVKAQPIPASPAPVKGFAALADWLQTQAADADPIEWQTQNTSSGAEQTPEKSPEKSLEKSTPSATAWPVPAAKEQFVATDAAELMAHELTASQRSQPLNNVPSSDEPSAAKAPSSLLSESTFSAVSPIDIAVDFPREAANAANMDVETVVEIFTDPLYEKFSAEINQEYRRFYGDV